MENYLYNQLFQLCGWHRLFLGAPLLTEQTGVNLLSRRPPLLVRLQQREGALERKRWSLILPKSELRDLIQKTDGVVESRLLQASFHLDSRFSCYKAKAISKKGWSSRSLW